MNKKNLLLYLSLALMPLTATAQSFSFNGTLTDDSGNPMAGPATISIKIYDPGETCLLYQEDFSSVTLNQGNFSIRIGDGQGTRSDSNTWSLGDVFSSRRSFNNASTCPTPYTPTATSNRKMRVVVNSTPLSPPYTLTRAPFASDSFSVGGFNAASLLRVEDAGVLGSTTPLNNNQYGQLMALIDGTSGLYTKPGELGGSALPTLSSGESVRWNGSSWESYSPLESGSETDPTVQPFAKTSLPTCTTGEVLKSDGTVLSCVTDASGAALPNVGTSGTYTKVTTDAQGRVISGSSIDGNDITSGTIGGTTIINTAGTVTAPQFFAQNGIAASPSYTFDSDPDTGMYPPASGDLAFSSNGIESMRITAGKNVGIGTTTPQAKLQVAGAIVGGFLDNSSSTTINWAAGNVQAVSTCNSFTFNSMVTGGVYKLIINNSSTLTACTFSDASSRTFKYPGNVIGLSGMSGATTGVQPTLVTFTTVNGTVFVEATFYNP